MNIPIIALVVVINVTQLALSHRLRCDRVFVRSKVAIHLEVVTRLGAACGRDAQIVTLALVERIGLRCTVTLAKSKEGRMAWRHASDFRYTLIVQAASHRSIRSVVVA